MSSVPLAALAIKNQQVDPLETYARVMQIQSMQGEAASRAASTQQTQLQNQNLIVAQQDDQKLRSAVAQAVDDSGNFDPQKFATYAYHQGAKPSSVTDFLKGVTAQQQSAATLTADQLKNAQTAADQYRGRIQAIVNGPEEDKLKNWSAEISAEETAYAKSGGQMGVPPGTITHVYPGDSPAQSFADHFAIGSTLAKEAIDRTTAQARQTTAQTGASRFAAEQNPQSSLYSPTPAALAAGTAPNAQAINAGMAKQAGAVEGAKAAAQFPYQQKLEQVRSQVQQQFGQNKDAMDKIEGTVLKPYEEKLSQVGELQSAVQQAAQGNVTAARGVLLKLIGVTNPDGTKRYNEAEATRLMQQGNIADRFAGSVKNLLTGDQWTDKMSQDMLSFAEAQASVATTNLNRGIFNVNKLYGTNVGQGLVKPDTSKKAKDPAGLF